MVMDVERRHLKINQVWIFQLDRQSQARVGVYLCSPSRVS